MSETLIPFRQFVEGIPLRSRTRIQRLIKELTEASEKHGITNYGPAGDDGVIEWTDYEWVRGLIQISLPNSLERSIREASDD